MVDMDNSVRLKRRLSLHHGVAIICGLVIGSGIYVSPTGVIQEAGSSGLSLVLWAAGGIISMFGAMTYAELGTTFPASGDKYVYLMKMYPPFIPFMFLWIYSLFHRTSGNAIKALLVSRFILQPIIGDCISEYLIIMVAFCLIEIIGILNCKTVTGSARFQTLMTSLNGFALTIIIFVGFYYSFSGIMGDWNNISFTNTNTNFIDLCVAMYSTIFAMGGWNALNFIVDELKNPYKNLPRALIISMCIIVTVHLLVNISYFVILGVDGVQNSPGVGMTYSHVTLGRWIWAMAVFVSCNVIGSLNGGILVGSRLCFAGAKNNHFPRIFKLVQIQYHTPIISVVFQTIMTMLMCCFNVFTLINNIMFSHVLFDVLVSAGLIYLRTTQPNLHRPLKLPLVVPMFYCLCSLVLILFPLLFRPSSTAIGVIICLSTGIPYYLFFVKRVFVIKHFDRLSDHFLQIVQKIFYCLPESVGNTGDSDEFLES